MKAKKIAVLIVGVVCIAYLGVRLVVPTMLEQQMNQVNADFQLEIDPQTLAFHQQLIVGDWHADSTLWNRDLGKQSEHGHVDLPRLRAGNVALQMFTTVTKSPDGLNYHQNDAQAPDNITKLALVQGWPISSWTNLTDRALYQAQKIHQLADDHPAEFKLIRNSQELEQFVQLRQESPKLIGALLGTEGSHALEGDLTNIQRLFDAGFSMMSLQHFFDNKLGGSLHGTSNSGLSEFGQQAVKTMQRLGVIVDVSHSSEQTVADVLKISTAPLVVSHTGFDGHCPSKRNINDDLMLQIASKGGLIAVGFWDEAVCGTSPDDIAQGIIYGISLVGEDHVALGSDFDGAVTTPFDTSMLVYITQALKNRNVDDQVIEKVMGGNMLRFLAKNLPSKQ